MDLFGDRVSLKLLSAECFLLFVYSFWFGELVAESDTADEYLAALLDADFDIDFDDLPNAASNRSFSFIGFEMVFMPSTDFCCCFDGSVCCCCPVFAVDIDIVFSASTFVSVSELYYEKNK